MALTITETMRCTAGGLKWRSFAITHDETTSTISAASMDLTFIQTVFGTIGHVASTAADASTLQAYLGLSIAAGNSGLVFNLPPKDGSKWNVTVVGW
jgi:hypothetical protein